MVEARVVDESIKDQWNQFIKDRPDGHVVQSWEWGEFRAEWGTEPVRIVVFDEDEIKAACSFTLHKAPLINKFVGYAGKGPVFADVTHLVPLISKIKEVAKDKNCIFVKFEPNVTTDPDQFFHKNLKKSPKEIFASQTLEIDLTKSEGELLDNFHEKWRYNIRLAARRDIAVESGESEEDLEEFIKLQRETASRDKFFIHPDNYYRTLWKKFHPHQLAHILTAKVDGEVAASWFLFTFGDYLYYTYGSSNYELRSYMPSHALMWSAIQFGRSKGLKRFDLWGAAKRIDGLLDEKDPWAGFTKFKEGFSPERKILIGAYDLVLNQPLYHTFALADKIRWLILRTLK